MKAFTTTVFASIFGLSLAGPLLHMRQLPSSEQVDTAIKTWISDVTSVNAFLNTVHILSSSDLSTQAHETLTIASDEPNQLQLLSPLSPQLSQPAQTSILTLGSIFGNVVTSLQNIANDPNADVAQNVQRIQSTRCCSVLPALDFLLPEAARVAGVEAPGPVPRPDACTDGTVLCG